MSTTRIGAALRRLVNKRAHGCCEYCLIHEDEVLLPHEADHIIAGQHGGETDEKNLCLACFHCNKLKGPNLAGIDPVTGRVEVLFHPRLDDWNAHFRFRGAEIEPRSARGRATVNVMRLNAPERLRLRTMLMESGRVFL
ncbi:MAG: HNH endonuclease signature motif containing protein [Prosthecobacter sp.]|nr:HNH endonuclease signature motif containing protein [Prosthecobacter sp.]HBJ86151.1 HNH endonuclease [Verrucomicrobiales bacterium]